MFIYVNLTKQKKIFCYLNKNGICFTDENKLQSNKTDTDDTSAIEEKGKKLIGLI